MAPLPSDATDPTGRAEAYDPLQRFGQMGLTFDDVCLVPAASDVVPAQVSTATMLTRDIQLAIPLMSAAMDTVTEARLAIAIAREGGLGVIHRNLSIEDQVAEVDKVKRSESGMIVDPVTLGPDDLVGSALDLMAKYRISGVPIVDGQHRLVGILTNRDLRFEDNRMRPVREVMTSEGLVTAPQGTTLEQAQAILGTHRIEKLPVVDDDGRITGLITVKDINKKIQYPDATKDDQGRLRWRPRWAWATTRSSVRGARGRRRGPDRRRHGARPLRRRARGRGEDRGQHPVAVAGGNIATDAAAQALLDAGADAIKVGVGPGSICTTRVVAGVGVPQLTAIHECAASLHVRRRDHRRRWHPLLGRHRQGARRGRGHRDGGQPARRRGREPGRDRASKGERSRRTGAWAPWAP